MSSSALAFYLVWQQAKTLFLPLFCHASGLAGQDGLPQAGDNEGATYMHGCN